MANSSKARPKRKRPKPSPDFPLWLHPSGRWCKKIRGRVFYFGKADEPDAALQRWVDEKDHLLAGRDPPQRRGGLVLVDLVNQFLTAKQQQVEAAELTDSTFQGYHALCRRLIDHFGRNRSVEGLRPTDFAGFRAELAKRCGPSLLSVEIVRTRSVFRFAVNRELIAEPVRYADAFRPPPARVLRSHRASKGELMFEADQLQRILAAVEQPLQTKILLGINCGFGAMDIARLPLSAVDLDAGLIVYPRFKTGIARRCPLWAETIEGLEEIYARRPGPVDKAAGKLVFLRPDGQPWTWRGKSLPIGEPFGRVLRRLGLYRNGLAFYSLRRTFRTIADETLDFPSVDLIMGHARKGMGDLYRQRIADARLRAVTAHVRQWLFEGRAG